MSHDSFWRRLVRGTRSIVARPDWEQLSGHDWVDRIMTVPVTDRFHAKQGRSTGRLILRQSDGRLAVYLKRHYHLPWWRGLLAALWPGKGWSPALQEYHHLRWARSLGIAVPEAVAAGEFIGPWGRLQSFLAVEELHEMLPLNEAIPLARRRLDPHRFARWKRSLIAEMARLTRLLHGQRVFHKDLYFCHFYIARSDTGILPSWRDRVSLIDLHRLARHRFTWRLFQSKDLAQLHYSTDVAGVTARDRLRFWRLYLGKEHRTWRGRWLRRLVMLRWRNYRDHNQRRRRSPGAVVPSSHAEAS